MLLSFLLPIQGLGLKFCLFNLVLEIPCPGCGMTRSITNISQLNFLDAFRYHPFGFVMYLFFVVLTVYVFLPAETKQRLREGLDANAIAFNRYYKGFLYALMSFGFVRGVSFLFDPGVSFFYR